MGREHGVPGGVGYAAARLGTGETVAALAIVNATGDVIGSDGSTLAGLPDDESGAPRRSAELIAGLSESPEWSPREAREGTTLICLMTDVALDKLAANKVARMASAGIARAVDPVFTPFDGDIVFCLASGGPGGDSWSVLRTGTLAASVTADAIRDAIAASNPGE